ncbi:MAG: tetratricopeptide repeat protein [Firmicutes bacterium]|nr:tetratricopeptide repeat protein [Bacillota bacterium]
MDLEAVQRAYRSGRYLTVLREAQRLLRDGFAGNREELLWLAGRAACHLGDWEQAVVLLTMLLSAKDLPAPRIHRATIWLANALGECGRLSEAEQFLLRLLSEEMLDPPLRGQALYNLGWVYQRQGKVDLALAAYQQAARVMLDADSTQDAVMALQNAAWLALSEGLEEGAELVRRAGEFVSRVGEAQRTHQLALEALAALFADRHAEALQNAEEILQPGHRWATDWDRAVAAFVVSETAARQGQPEMAAFFARHARRFARAVGDERLLRTLRERERLRPSLVHPRRNRTRS